MIRVIGAWMIACSVMVFVTHAGSLWMSMLIVLVGFGLVAYSEEQEIVIDGASRVARITNREFRGPRIVRELAFDDILDIAVERAPMATRGVLVRRDGSLVPWEPWSRLTTVSQASLVAKSVAAARVVTGTRALPTEVFIGQQVPVIHSKRGRRAN